MTKLKLKKDTSLAIPRNLTGKARAAAEAIVALLMLEIGPSASGHGCKAFYTKAAWKRRGEKYGYEGDDEVLVVVHDGGDLAPYFNYEYGENGKRDRMAEALRKVGCYAEQCTSWYSVICA